MNKPAYVGMSILDISKTLIYKFWCDFIKTIEQNYVIQILISFITHIITEDFSEGIADNVTKWFVTKYIYDENDKRPLPMGINKKVYSFLKDQLGGKIMKDSN